MARKKMKEQIAEDEWLMSLPTPFKVLMGAFRYRLKEILILTIVIILGIWFLTSFEYIGKKAHIKPGVKIEYKGGNAQ